MNKNNTKIVVCRYNECIKFLNKFDIPFILYEKELDKKDKELYKKDKELYKKDKELCKKKNINIIKDKLKNKGHESVVYLKYIIDNYDSLDEYTILIHCHEYSWHHKGSIALDKQDGCLTGF